MLKNQKGITLISLVVTVIVLLILGGVAITDATISNAIEMKGLAERTKIY